MVLEHFQLRSSPLLLMLHLQSQKIFHLTGLFPDTVSTLLSFGMRASFSITFENFLSVGGDFIVWLRETALFEYSIFVCSLFTFLSVSIHSECLRNTFCIGQCGEPNCHHKQTATVKKAFIFLHFIFCLSWCPRQVT